MSTVPFDIQAAADLVDLSIQEIFMKSGEELDETFREYYNVETVEDQLVKDSSISTIDAFSRVPEGAEIPADSPIQGFDKTYTQAKYAGMLRITDQMWMFGIKTRDLESVVLELRRNAVRYREQVLANVLNNATATSYTETTGNNNFTVTNTGGDGVAFASAAHTREDGGANWANIVDNGTTTNMDFAEDALETAMTVAQAILGPRGEVLDMNPDTVVVKKRSSAHFEAMRVQSAIQRGGPQTRPATADNDAVSDIPFKIIALPHLTSDTAWAMFDSSKKNSKFGLQYKESMPLTLSGKDIKFENDEIRYKGMYFFGYGFNDARNWVYSNGTNA